MDSPVLKEFEIPGKKGVIAMKWRGLSLFAAASMLVLFAVPVKAGAGDFTLLHDKILTASDLPTYTITEFSGKSDVMWFENTSAVQTRAIRYGGLEMTAEYSAANRYLLVDCYLDDTSISEFSLSVVFRRVYTEKWINSDPINTKGSVAYPAGRWVTVSIDCAEPLGSLANNNYSLDQLQINIPSAAGDLYVGEVRFSSVNVEPAIAHNITLAHNKIMSADDLPTYTITDHSGRTDVLKFENTSEVSTKGIRYDGLSITAGSSCRYLLADCFLEEDRKSVV